MSISFLIFETIFLLFPFCIFLFVIYILLKLDSDVEDPSKWLEALNTLLHSIPVEMKKQVKSICISGTSSTCLMVDKRTHLPSRNRKKTVKLYNWDGMKHPSGEKVIELIKKYASTSTHPTIAPSSTLVKLLTWHMDEPITNNEQLFHQADYIASYLLFDKKDQDIPSEDAREGLNANCKYKYESKSDWNNVLKLGFDLHTLKWPSWITDSLFLDDEIKLSSNVLPTTIVEPGDSFGQMSPLKCKKWDFPLENNIEIIAGTTDSIAAFIACGPELEGEAVTSLGSTLAIKMLSKVPIEDVQKGVYSHRFHDNLWLVGGASNVGCEILRQENFSNEEMIELMNSEEFDPLTDSKFEYIPLVGENGERFPICDPKMKKRIDPKPLRKRLDENQSNNKNDPDEIDRVEYFKALLQGITRTEKKGFDTLVELGACQVKRIFTAGGGAKNTRWVKMRKRILNVPIDTVIDSKHTEASYGAAKLALKKFNKKL